MLRLNELTVRRGRTLIVERLDWVVRPGRPAWVVGPNGAGKSSLLRVMAGLARPAAGAVILTASADPPLYFHPETGLPADSTVGDWERLIRALLPSCAGATPLRPAVPDSRRVGALSTGERKRLLLDALLRQAGDALLLDEPYEHLSRDARDALTSLIEARARSAVVVIATNQLTGLAERQGGLRLEGGAAVRLPGASS